MQIFKAADAIISHFIYESGLIGHLLSKKLEIPHYVSIHENCYIQYKNAFFWKRMLKVVLKSASRIFVNSSMTKNLITDFIPEINSKIELIHLVVDEKYFSLQEGSKCF